MTENTTPKTPETANRSADPLRIQPRQPTYAGTRWPCGRGISSTTRTRKRYGHKSERFRVVRHGPGWLGYGGTCVSVFPCERAVECGYGFSVETHSTDRVGGDRWSPAENDRHDEIMRAYLSNVTRLAEEQTGAIPPSTFGGAELRSGMNETEWITESGLLYYPDWEAGIDASHVSPMFRVRVDYKPGTTPIPHLGTHGKPVAWTWESATTPEESMANLRGVIDAFVSRAEQELLTAKMRANTYTLSVLLNFGSWHAWDDEEFDLWWSGLSDDKHRMIDSGAAYDLIWHAYKGMSDRSAEMRHISLFQLSAEQLAAVQRGEPWPMRPFPTESARSDPASYEWETDPAKMSAFLDGAANGITDNDPEVVKVLRATADTLREIGRFRADLARAIPDAALRAEAIRRVSSDPTPQDPVPGFQYVSEPEQAALKDEPARDVAEDAVKIRIGDKRFAGTMSEAAEFLAAVTDDAEEVARIFRELSAFKPAFKVDPPAIQIGDVVRLRSGGPKMTVQNIDQATSADPEGAYPGHPSMAVCSWFETNRRGRAVECETRISLAALEVVTPVEK